ncbi:MAG: hypothetical protein ACFB4I_17585 [Cyanophyceae cyanobacterium]
MPDDSSLSPSEPPNIDSLNEEPPTRHYDYHIKASNTRIRESQEATRSFLAPAVLIIYALTLVGCFGVVLWGLDKDERQEVITLIITSQGTLIGTAVGFYFGKNQ